MENQSSKEDYSWTQATWSEALSFQSWEPDQEQDVEDCHEINLRTAKTFKRSFIQMLKSTEEQA